MWDRVTLTDLPLMKIQKWNLEEKLWKNKLETVSQLPISQPWCED